MKEFTLINEVHNNPNQISHFPTALQNLDDFAVERRFGNTTPLKTFRRKQNRCFRRFT